MTLHVRFEYPISMPSFIPIHWLVFFCMRVDALEQEKENDNQTTCAIPICLVIPAFLPVMTSVTHRACRFKVQSSKHSSKFVQTDLRLIKPCCFLRD